MDTLYDWVQNWAKTGKCHRAFVWKTIACFDYKKHTHYTIARPNQHHVYLGFLTALDIVASAQPAQNHSRVGPGRDGNDRWSVLEESEGY